MNEGRSLPFSLFFHKLFSMAATKIQYLPRPEVKTLSERSNLWGWWLTVHAWGVIALAGALFIVFPNPLTYIIAIAIIGGRQLGLAILMHESAHGILFKTPVLNKIIGQYFMAYPIGLELNAYRSYHLKHHKYVQQPEDPDLGLSAAFPTSRASLVRKFLRDITGLTGLKLRGGQLLLITAKLFGKGGNIKGYQAIGAKAIIGPYLLNAFIFAAFWMAGYWWVYVMLWLAPLFTVFQLVLRIRNIAEHAQTSHTPDNPLTTARTTHANLLARAFVAPYWVNYHVEHHLYMYTPCWRYKKLHTALKREGYAEEMETQPSYWAVIKLATTPCPRITGPQIS